MMIRVIGNRHYREELRKNKDGTHYVVLVEVPKVIMENLKS